MSNRSNKNERRDDIPDVFHDNILVGYANKKQCSIYLF
jgi:hypothetical protein